MAELLLDVILIYFCVGLQLRQKHPKRRVKAKLRDDRAKAVGPNDVWAMDFVYDQLATGKNGGCSLWSTHSHAKCRFWTRSSATEVRTSCRPRQRVVSRDMDLWAYQRDVTLDFSGPGKPTDNAFIEVFNARFRAECLNAHWFLTLADTAKKLEAWRRYYNEERPHGMIGNKVPIMLTKSRGVTLSKAGKLCLRATQGWGSDHNRSQSLRK